MTTVNTAAPATVRALAGFAKPDKTYPDPDNPGCLRAEFIPEEDYSSFPYHRLDMQTISVRDWGEDNTALDLWEMGFDCTDLTSVPGLLDVLQDVATSNYLTTANIKNIRRKLWGRALPLSNGKKMRILFIAGDGFILRKGGPNGANVCEGEERTDSNGHVTGAIIHGDQDVFGTPVKQILKGLAPKVFRHQTMGQLNSRSPLALVNLWLPLQQITEPLALLDRRTLDPKRQQLRYGYRVTSFIERDEDMAVNDLWMFLYDKAQQWYFNSELHAGKAYVFDTLGEAHGGVILSGEKEAEQYFLCLKSLCEALDNRDKQALDSAASLEAIEFPHDTTAPLRKASDEIYRVIAAARGKSIDELLQSDWRQQADRALDAVVRKSIELRAVVWLS